MNEVDSIKHVNGGKMESYRCNTCSIEFNLVDELIDHTQVNHASSDVVVTCGRCQIVCNDINEFLEHHRTAHDEEPSEQEAIVLQDGLKHDHIHLEVSNQDSDIVQEESVTRITIVNDDGEAIGLASGGEEISVVNTDHNTSSGDVSLNSSSVVTSGRKRRVPLKYRDQFLESPPSKRAVISPLTLQNSNQNIYPKKEDIEIDITNLSSIRFKSSQSIFNKEILAYLQRVDEKLNCIIKHFNVPFTSQHADDKQNNFLNKIQSRKSSLQKHSDAIENNGLSTITMAVPRRQSTIRSPSNPRQESVTYISCEAPPQEITQYVISDDLLEATFMKSRNRGNFAKNLVYAAFPLEERLGRNCYGRRGGALSGPKDPLESAKLDAVKEAVFKKFPVLDGDEEEAIWKRECVIAIDTALRSEMRTRIMNMQPVKHDVKHELKHALMNMPM